MSEAGFELLQASKLQSRIGELLAALSRDGWSLDDLQALTENHLVRLDAMRAVRHWAYDRVVKALSGHVDWEIEVGVWEFRTMPAEVWYAESQRAISTPAPTSPMHVREKHFLNRGYLSDIVKVALARFEESGMSRTYYIVFVRLDERTNAAFDVYSHDGRLLGGADSGKLHDLAEAIRRITEANPV